MLCMEWVQVQVFRYPGQKIENEEVQINHVN